MFVQTFVAANGYSPSYEEIRQAVGLSSRSHVSYYLKALERDGLVKRIPRQPRGLSILGLAEGSSRIRSAQHLRR